MERFRQWWAFTKLPGAESSCPPVFLSSSTLPPPSTPPPPTHPGPLVQPPPPPLPTVCDFCSAVFIHHQTRLCALFLALLPSPSRGGALPILGVVATRGRRRRPAGGNRAYQARSLRATYWSKRRSSCLMHSIMPLAKCTSSFILGSVVLKWGAAPTKAEVQGLVSILIGFDAARIEPTLVAEQVDNEVQPSLLELCSSIENTSDFTVDG